MLLSFWTHFTRAMRISFYVLLGLLIGSMTSLARAEEPRVLAIGDSLMASHSISGRNIAGYLGKALGTKVTDRSVLGAHMVYRLPISGAMGMSIPAQFRQPSLIAFFCVGRGHGSCRRGGLSGGRIGALRGCRFGLGPQ